ncbi:MAG TPA: lipocalin family protein [Gammaproteobacteria bacterium]|nr:lipocalin family protein [Gammaproteobacteria bacterium]
MKPLARLSLLFPLVALAACSSMPAALQTVEHVDLPRFMGDWYVIASIPTFIERGAHNAIESYELVSDRQVATTFRFNDGAFDGPLRTYRPTGFVREDPSNAVWGMQFIWPIKADYRVMYLNEDYTHTVIGRNKRDYVWIMARTRTIPEGEFINLVRLIEEQGYDAANLRRVPQRNVTAGVKQP